jgi:Domain of unknown function (DUF4272)
MDPDETMCPQCGHGKEAAYQKKMAKVRPPPEIKIDWNASPSARRLALRAGMQPPKSWWQRLFGGRPARPAPPSPRRVAARAMVLATVVARAYLETQLADIPNANAIHESLHAFLNGLGIAAGLEPHEHAFLEAPLGGLAPQSVIDASWRGEGLTVLAWAMNRLELPAYDERVPFAPFAAQDAVGLAIPDVARRLLDAPMLRPAVEIDRFASHVTVVGWRLRQFGIVPAPMDYVAYLRQHGSFTETWLEQLRFVNGDLAIGDCAIADAPAEQVVHCRGSADERRIAAYWLQGDDAIYSKVDPATLLSAC